MVVFRDNFRDIQEWEHSTRGYIKLNTSSDMAAKQYDATVTQLCGWYEDESLGGIGGSLERMQKADPEFVLGRALDLEIKLAGSMDSPRLNKRLADELGQLNELVGRRAESVNEHELLHVEVVNKWSRGELKGAAQTLERLVTLFPEDVAALKLTQDTYFMLGSSFAMRNSLAGSLRDMSTSNPLKGYVHGMFAFALEESNMYPAAMGEAERALGLIPHDTWAIHNYAHCLEMQAQPRQGLAWMEGRRPDWVGCKTLSCHQYWHTALFHINLGQLDEAASLLELEVAPRCLESGTSLDIHDAASMVYRMELADVFGKLNKGPKEVSEKWAPVFEVCKRHQHDHLLGFNDAHYMMAYLGMGELQMARDFIDELETLGDQLVEGHTVVRPLLEAMYQFKVANYGRAVDLLEPIRFEVIKIGGSHAQRDVFEQLLLVAALRSDKLAHRRLGHRMLAERDTMQGGRSKQTSLLAGRELAGSGGEGAR